MSADAPTQIEAAALWDAVTGAGIDFFTGVPDSLLKGITNERLVRLLRGLNPEAKIIATADVLAQIIAGLRARGYRLVTVTELLGIPWLPAERDAAATAQATGPV